MKRYLIMPMKSYISNALLAALSLISKKDISRLKSKLRYFIYFSLLNNKEY